MQGFPNTLDYTGLNSPLGEEYELKSLAVEGRVFRDATPLLERSVKEGWPVEVDFQEDPSAGWPPLDQAFHIRHLANTIDPVNRTFAFRPGQKVRLLVRVEKFDNVFVLPADAVAREGPEAFVFTQNVNTFERKPVRILLQDRQHVVVANDGSLLPGAFAVQTAAAQLNRMVKAGSSGVPSPRTEAATLPPLSTITTETLKPSLVH